MKILYHHRTRLEDAQGIHIFEMVNAFRDLGHQVDMVALVKEGRKAGESAQGRSWGIFTKWIPNWLYELMSLAYNLYGYRLLYRAIRLKRPDLIYERYALNTFCGIWASLRFNIPMILEVNAPLYYEQNNLGNLTFKWLARHSEPWICSRSTLTVAVTNVMKKILVEEGVPAEKIVVIPNGVDPQKLHPGVSGEKIRRRHSLNGELVVGFVGWFRKWHGLDILLKIMHEEHLLGNGIRLLLIGNGPAFSDLCQYVETHELQSSVIFTGPIKQQDVAEYIAAMDIAVQPSATEYACPMKIFEYMALGKCIVAPDQPNIREILQDGVNAFLFRPHDWNHFKMVLLSAIQNPTRREYVAKKASETIYQRRYFWTANAEKTLNLVFGDEVQTATSQLKINTKDR